MGKVRLDISSRRFHPVWLIIGALIGAGLGRYSGMNFAFWYFANPAVLIMWQILGAIAFALFASFLMTSDVSPALKGSLLGAGIGFACAFYGASIWTMFPPEGGSPGLAGISVANGIFLDWLILHASILGFFVGWIAGAVAARRNRAQSTADVTSTSIPESGPHVEEI
jgi:hypothetical protein